jgi:hypothetical protein
MCEICTAMPARSPNLDRLPKRLEALVRFVADVRHVDAAVPRRDFRELDELARLGIAADFVLETARQPHGALAHRLIEERRHPRHLVGPRRTLEIVAHHQAANRRMAGERGDVERGRIAAALRQVLANRPRRPAVGPDDGGRDTLRDLRFRCRVAGQFLGRVVVDVDEARRDDQSRAGDDRVAALGSAAVDRHDAIVDDAHVDVPERAAVAVGDIGADDDPRARRRLRAGPRGQQRQRGDDGEASNARMVHVRHVAPLKRRPTTVE